MDDSYRLYLIHSMESKLKAHPSRSEGNLLIPLIG